MSILEKVILERERQLVDIQKSENTEVDFCNRLYAFGSTKNIPSNYRKVSEDETIDAIVQKKLRMPLTVGDYIDSSDNLKYQRVVPRILTFEEIYPKRIGKITSLRIEEKKDDDGKPFVIYYFKDDDLQFKSDYIIIGETLGLVFGENSWLYGRDFELGYNDKTSEFEIINIQEGDHYVPNSILTPRVGDEYVLYGFDISLVGDQYIPEAEQELYDKAKEYLDIINKDNAIYTCKINPVYRFENDLDLTLGQKVKMQSLIFDNGSLLLVYMATRNIP